MKEDLLHLIWEKSLYDHKNLTTVDGRTVSIYEVGQHNTDSGPDFLNARIRLDGVDWIGNIELHVRAGEWDDHDHILDPMYDSVILHVCVVADKIVYRSDGTPVPTLSLDDRIDHNLLSRYEDLVNTSQKIPCAAILPEVEMSLWKENLQLMMLRRSSTRLAAITSIYHQTRGNWHQTYYQMLSKGLGGHLNQEPFTRLAYILPHRLIARYRHSLFDLEALLFGQAGFLGRQSEGPPELANISEVRNIGPYPEQLIDRYHFLQVLHSLEPMPVHEWKFLRTRPANFPTVRIAQFAGLLHTSNSFISQLRNKPSLPDLRHWFTPVVSDFWRHHYTLFGPAKEREFKLGTEKLNQLIINVYVPLQLLYSEHYGDKSHREHAENLMQEIEPEKNKVTRMFESMQKGPSNAYESQALLQLFSKQCNFKQCLECKVGQQIISKNEKANHSNMEAPG